MTTITRIQSLPGSPFNGSEFVGIVITSGIPSYFKLSGVELDRIVSVQWYPKNPASVLFKMRQIILLDSTVGTFMVQVLDNYLDACDRGGYLSFTLIDSSVLTFPVKTYGRVSLGPLWTAPDQGLITGN